MKIPQQNPTGQPDRSLSFSPSKPTPLSDEDEEVFKIVKAELNNNDLHAETWAKAWKESRGNERNAKDIYFRDRFAQLKADRRAMQFAFQRLAAKAASGQATPKSSVAVTIGTSFLVVIIAVILLATCSH